MPDGGLKTPSSRRRETLVRHLRDVSAEVQAERQAIQGKLAALLVGGPGSRRDTHMGLAVVAQEEVPMIQAQILQGRVEVQDPIPASWEGQTVNIVPLTPEDPLPDLEGRLAALHRMGPVEFEPGEREQMAAKLEELDRVSAAAMAGIEDGRR